MGSIPRGEILKELDKHVLEKSSYLLPIEKCWQPSDYVPDMSREDWFEQTRALRERMMGLPDSVLVSLVANMITEEALPSYHKWLDSLEGGLDDTGTSERGMAVWTRGWVAEEKRHGDVLQKYLYLSGRVNFHAIDVTIQHLLKNGFNPETENDIYLGFVYTSFQERATFVSHSGIAKLARQHGDTVLANICDHISGDEVRHGKAYERFMSVIYQMDPDGGMEAFAKMMQRKIVMPARHITDGKEENLFQLFSSITEQNGSYTAMDYAEIIAHLVRAWRISDMTMTTDSGKKAQEYLVGLPDRYFKLAERSIGRRTTKGSDRPVSWIFDRTVGATHAAF